MNVEREASLTDGGAGELTRTMWAESGMPWRTEPEIDEARQRYLTERRAITPDIAHAEYPFKDISLTRADIEWLLTTHMDGGLTGPVDPDDPDQLTRFGLDLRGAVLDGVDLSDLPLAALHGGLTQNEQDTHGRELRYDAAIHLEGARLVHAHLERACLARARMEGANLEGALMMSADLGGAHCEGVLLKRANLAGAYLRGASFNERSNLNELRLQDSAHGSARMVDLRWSGTNLAVIDWEHVTRTGEETLAEHAAQEQPSGARGRVLRRYNAAVRSYRQLATALRAQGLNEDADRFAYRAQKLQAVVLWRQGHRLRWLGSTLLDLVAGYGYHPLRSVITYALLIVGFAAAYLALGHAVTPALGPLDALIFSITSFHGRGFSPGATVTLHSPLTVLAAMEAVIGLLIEIIFIATFTQRFFAH